MHEYGINADFGVRKSPVNYVPSPFDRTRVWVIPVVQQIWKRASGRNRTVTYIVRCASDQSNIALITCVHTLSQVKLNLTGNELHVVKVTDGRFLGIRQSIYISYATIIQTLFKQCSVNSTILRNAPEIDSSSNWRALHNAPTGPAIHAAQKPSRHLLCRWRKASGLRRTAGRDPRL